MTYEDLYKPAIDSYQKKWETYFSQFALKDAAGMNILQLRDELDSRVSQLKKLEAEAPDNFDFNLSAALERYFAAPIAQYAKAVSEISERYAQKRASLEQQHADAITSAEVAAENSISELSKKYNALLTYKDKISDVILRYGIKPSTLEIDMDSISKLEMEALIDTALSACKSLGDSPVRKWLKLLYDPPEDKEDDARLYYAIAVIVGSVVLAPLVFIAMYAYMFWHTSHIYRNVDNLRIADKLMYGVDCAKFRDPPKFEEIPDVDYAGLQEQEQRELDAFSANDPVKSMEVVQQEINKCHSKIASDFRAATNMVMGRYTALLRIYKSGIATLQQSVDEYMSNLKEFGAYCNTAFVMDTDYVLGKQKGVLDVKYNVGLQNLVFAARTPEMLLFIKLMLANAMLSVRPKQLRCVVYDPAGLGADFATFMSQETADYISVATNDLSKCLDPLRAYSQGNLRVLDQRDINDFNKEAAEKGMVALEYRLLIIISGVDKPQDNKILTEFMQFSARTGAIVWLVSPRPVTGCLFYRQPFENIEEPYNLTPALFAQVMQTYTDAFKNLKDEGILYIPAFAERYLPESKWWQENTDKGIKLNFGLQDGDPSKGYAIELGDANVHALCVGATGAGKSAFNNQLIAALITRYPPSALELIMVDFKNIEFGSLVDKQTNISRIPHARIIAGTKDGEYAISIFDYLMEEMERRTRLFDEASVKKLEDYNKKMRVAGTPERCIPRILLIIDEFQVMFTEVDPKSVDVIQSRIRSLSKLARFCGCHMLFTSQSMKGTMSKDIMDQFSLRIALRCSADTSSELIGSPVASKIKQKFGYLYTNTNAGETQDSTRIWRTPFLPDEDLFDTEKRNQKIASGKLPADTLCILDAVCKLAEERHELHHHAYFYDEKEQYPDSKLKEWLQSHQDVIAKEKRLMVLGERTGFTTKKSPVNFKLKRTDGENILMYGFEEADFNNLVMTMVDNIKADPAATLLINCADNDLYTVLCVDEWYTPELLDIAKPMVDVTDWVELLNSKIEERKSRDPSTYGPIYFLCLRWDKQLGICRNENYKLTDAWKNVVTSGPSVDIHIIFCAQLFKEIPSSVIALYNHTICARGPEEAGYKLMSNGKLAKLPDTLGFALYQYGSSVQKFKIYQHTFSRQAESREIEGL